MGFSRRKEPGYGRLHRGATEGGARKGEDQARRTIDYERGHARAGVRLARFSWVTACFLSSSAHNQRIAT